MVQRADHQEKEVALVRVLGKDILGDKKLGAGLTDIKGISWALANAICKTLELDRNKLISDISEAELKKLEDFSTHLEVPSFLKNRQKDFDEGENVHLLGADLKLKVEFDVKRLRKIKAYRGTRHAANLPSRGQRTKSNFRRNRKKSGATGVRKK